MFKRNKSLIAILPIKPPPLEEIVSDIGEVGVRFDILMGLITDTLKDDARIKGKHLVIGTYGGNYALYVFRRERDAWKFYDNMADNFASPSPEYV